MRDDSRPWWASKDALARMPTDDLLRVFCGRKPRLRTRIGLLRGQNLSGRPQRAAPVERAA